MPDPSRYETLARGALLEITPAATVGDFVGEIDEGNGAVSVLFESAQPGYPGWKWTVSIAQVEGEDPTVLEAELMPSDGALLSPDWVPWSDRLAEYKAAQEPLGDDDDELDEDDILGNDVLHGGDLDGVDIDDLDGDSPYDNDPDDNDPYDNDPDDNDPYDNDPDDEAEKTY